MKFAIQKIVVTRNDQTWREAAYFFNARRKFGGATVQDGPWFVDVEKVTGHHVAAEKKIVLGAVKPAVTPRVARQMDHAQPAPERKLLSVGDEFVNGCRSIPKDKSACRFQPTAPTIDSFVRITAIDVLLLLGMSGYTRASPLLQPREISSVIEMAMREEDRFDGIWFQAEPLHESLDEERFANHPGINHHARIAVFEQVATAHDATDGVELWKIVVHGAVSQEITGLAALSR